MTARLTAGSPKQLGATCDGTGVNFAVFSAHATAIDICLFDSSGTREIRKVRLPERSGDIYHGHLEGVKAGQLYGLRAHGDYDPGRGHRFNPNKLLVDPYATRLTHGFALHPAVFGYEAGQQATDLSFSTLDSAPFMPKAIVEAAFDTQASARPNVPWDKTIIYELPVRGFTLQHPDVPEELRGTFSGLAHPSVIAHFTELGVTTLELMPSMAWVDERHLGPLGLSNVWGYNPVALMVPDARLAPGGWQEIRDCVAAYHAAGIEIILDVVLNHTGEGDELGPTLSFRGLDNASYYRLNPDNRRTYINDAGTGNVLALDHPAVLRLAMDALRLWARRTGIDGFRFDLAATLGRRADGFDPHAPLLSAIAQDPELAPLKMIAEPWDIGPGGYQIGRFDADWAEWNDQARDTMRRFWRGDTGMLGALATRFCGSQDLFGSKNRPSRSINFITAHDGFTLADLVSHAEKHNEANGEHNKDGTDANFSWNHGVEGDSTNLVTTAARLRDQRNLLATLLLARGTPMLSAGSDFGHTQQGNNNAYAQDIALDWARADQSLMAFTARATTLRKAHPALRNDRFLTGKPVDGSLLPDVEWRNADGTPMHDQDWNNAARRTLIAALYVPATQESASERMFVVVHAGDHAFDLTLPEPRDGMDWSVLLDSSQAALPDETAHLAAYQPLAVPARCVVVLAESESANALMRQPTDSLLDRLSKEAGIAPDWWDIGGGHHLVPRETKLAILKALGLEAETAAQARASLTRLCDETYRRILPMSAVLSENGPLTLTLSGPGINMPLQFVAQDEEGILRSTTINPEDGESDTIITPDDKSVHRRIVQLAQLPRGRHRIWVGGHEEQSCALAVVPDQCFMPDGMARWEFHFGIAAHLYALRRKDDQGIGDFTSLAELGEAAAAKGAALIGLNPLHALFPNDRERASPYHPCDRRWLDPIWLDIRALPQFTGMTKHDSVSELAHVTLNSQRYVDYPAVWSFKKAILEEAFEAFALYHRTQAGDALALDYLDFIKNGGETLASFAHFKALAEKFGTTQWQSWPDIFQHPDGLNETNLPDGHHKRWHFSAFLQWLCERQLADAATRAKAAGLKTGLYRDLAIGAAPDGAEAWASGEAQMQGLSIGAPPDPFNAQGQVWHLPPPNPLVWKRLGYTPFASLLRSNMRHAGALRIDHVLGLARLFCVPDGMSAAQGAYLAYPLHDLLGHLALESMQARCLVVGEDLGTVPEHLGEKLHQAKVLSCRVMWFEQEDGNFRRSSSYPVQCASSISTHDLPTFAGWWTGADIEERHSLGLLDDNAAGDAKSLRAAERASLLEALRKEGIFHGERSDDSAPDIDLSAAVHTFLSRTPSLLALVQVDDLAGETEACNLPGTDRERPNWRRRLKQDMPDLFTSPLAEAILASFANRRA